jgi:hypothetical protein
MNNSDADISAVDWGNCTFFGSLAAEPDNTVSDIVLFPPSCVLRTAPPVCSLIESMGGAWTAGITGAGHFFDELSDDVGIFAKDWIVAS